MKYQRRREGLAARIRAFEELRGSDGYQRPGSFRHGPGASTRYQHRDSARNRSRARRTLAPAEV